MGAQVKDPHASSGTEVLEALGATSQGLDTAEARERSATYGPNSLPDAKPKPLIFRYLKHFDDVLIYILLVAALLKAIIGDWVEFWVILVAAVTIATVGFIQDGQAQKALAGLKSMLALDAQVRRDNQWVVIDATELVPGDRVRVRSGDRVPADLRVLSATNLQVDEAALTGESLPADKDTRAVRADAGLGDRSSMLFSSTIITSGTAEGVVTAIGSQTEIGRITSLVSEVEAMDTPLTKQIGHLGKQISIMIGVLAAAMLITGRLVHNLAFDDLLAAAIGFAVAAVPEGLPALVTITLALGVQQMAKRRAIARKMTAVEALGSVTTICSDKTGTLTQNEMTARQVYTAERKFAISGVGYEPVGEVSLIGTKPGSAAEAANPEANGNSDEAGSAVVLEEQTDLLLLARAAALCNNAQVEKTEQGWRVVGQPTEGALDVLAVKTGVQLDGVSRLAEVPFESAHKFSATVDQLPDGAQVMHVVGAPDRLLARATGQADSAGEVTALDEQLWQDKISELSAQGLRVLGVAWRPDAADFADKFKLKHVQELVFLGVVGIVDPPRPEAQQAIAEARGAGIRVKMITGDHVGTAVAIAQELGISNDDGELRALTGAELDQMTQDDLRVAAPDVDVYARTSPEHKLRIVRALQSNKHIVAMTGDGVNDAPSITRADIGVAMGIKGTEATKEAAGIVLADDNFATIAAAVEEGRRIYDNIRKSVVFLLPTNGAQSLVIFVAILLGIALPLSPVQILWINLITAVTLSLPLALEPSEPGIMQRRPRDANERVLSKNSLLLVGIASLVIGGLTILTYLITREAADNYAVAQTTAVTMLALGQLAYLFNCRILNGSSFTGRAFTGNRSVWLAAGALLVLQLLFIYAPFMNNLFRSAPIPLQSWLLVIALAVAVFVIMESAKALQRRRLARRYARR